MREVTVEKNVGPYHVVDHAKFEKLAVIFLLNEHPRDEFGVFCQAVQDCVERRKAIVNHLKVERMERFFKYLDFLCQKVDFLK